MAELRVRLRMELVDEKDEVQLATNDSGTLEPVRAEVYINGITSVEDGVKIISGYFRNILHLITSLVQFTKISGSA